MAFEKIAFAMKTWKDKVSGNTPITAAELNRIEKGISDTAKGVNDLGDSVSRSSKALAQESSRSVRYAKVGAVVEVGVYIQVQSSQWKEIVSGLPIPAFESYFHATADDAANKQVKIKVSSDGTLSCRYMGNATGASTVDCMFVYLANG